jgi:hypothetical protein
LRGYIFVFFADLNFKTLFGFKKLGFRSADAYLSHFADFLMAESVNHKQVEDQSAFVGELINFGTDFIHIELFNGIVHVELAQVVVVDFDEILFLVLRFIEIYGFPNEDRFEPTGKGFGVANLVEFFVDFNERLLEDVFGIFLVLGIAATDGEHGRGETFVKLFFGFRVVVDAALYQLRIVQNGLLIIV